MACQWRLACNESDANGWKMIAARLAIHLNGGPLLAAKTGPPGPILAAKFGPGGPVLAKFLPKSVRGDHFWGGPILV